MRRLGTLLMILGANLVVGSIAIGFYTAALGCAIGVADGMCTQGALGLYFDLMGSAGGVVFWIVIAVGVLVFWKGRRLRARATD